MKRIAAISLLSLLSVMPMLAERVSVEYTVNPPMSCQNCVDKIKTNMRFEKGIKKVNPQLELQVVEIEYDDTKTNPEAIRNAFAKIGYEAVVAGSPEAEAACKQAEAACKQAEAACKQNEAACKQAEAACKQNEAACKQAEAACKQNEAACKQAEAACQKAEGGCCKKAAAGSCNKSAGSCHTNN